MSVALQPALAEPRPPLSPGSRNSGLPLFPPQSEAAATWEESPTFDASQPRRVSSRPHGEVAASRKIAT